MKHGQNLQQPLSRRSQSNSRAMTVKEHDQRKDSLSLCSVSD